jgi:acyl-CoA dehydrogenase
VDALNPSDHEAARKSALEAARSIGHEIAAQHADAVDRDARFPGEALDAWRRAKLLGALVPVELGGLGARLGEVAAMTQALAQGCASAGMVFAMHQIQVGCIVRHGAQAPQLQPAGSFFSRYLRDLCAEQRLIASVTSEVGVGGSLRTSVTAVERDAAGGCKLTKNATTVSYGQAADDLLITARRAPDAAAGDQVLVLVRRGESQLEPRGDWDTLGMRGTCSPPFLVSAAFPSEQILPAPFADISSQTMVPFSHLLWSSCWLGIATDAVARARAFVQAEARKNPGTTPPAASRLAEAAELLYRMRDAIDCGLREYESLMADPESLSSVGFALRINHLKVAASQLAVEVANKALLCCGIAGYKSGSKFSVGRHLRDLYSAPLMIANDRILSTNAALLLVHKGA